jgi:Gamma tubulin complex component C-terminal
VVEVQFTQMIKSIKETENFEDILKAHCLAISNILTQAFLHSGVKQEGKLLNNQHAVMSCLLVFLDMNSQFCAFAKAAIENGTALTSEMELELQEMEQKFMSQVGVLKNMLTIVQCQTSALALSQLLLRLDLNDWFKKNVIA